MSAERGWIGEPPAPTEWRMPGWVKEGGRHFVPPPGADRIAARQAREMRDIEELAGLNRRYAHLHTPKHLTNPDHLGEDIPTISSGGAPLRIAPRYAAGRPRRRLR
jgi:hypothetical protein